MTWFKNSYDAQMLYIKQMLLNTVVHRLLYNEWDIYSRKSVQLLCIIHQTFDTFHNKTLQTQKLLQNPEKSTLLLLFYFISILISQKAKPKNYLDDPTDEMISPFFVILVPDPLSVHHHLSSLPLPGLMSSTSLCRVSFWAPLRGFPLRRHWLLCVWNRRGQHSCAQAPNKGTNSCRNNPDSRWGCKPIRCSEVRASLKVDNQCLCEAIWCQQAEKVHPAASQSCSLSCADGLPCCGNGDGLFWMDHHRQCWIITAKYDSFSLWIIDGQNLLFWTGYWPG